MEFVFVAPREELFPACYPQGFHAFPEEVEGQAFVERAESCGFFVERSRAERTPAWKQLIPYCLVVHEQKVLLMRRRAKGGESRLFGKLTIGVGGHVNPQDRDPRAGLVVAAARREIAEELELPEPYELRLVGFLNDDSNPVGAVHVGLIHVVTAPSLVRVREEEVLEGSLVDPEELRARLSRGEDFETWSSMLLAHIHELVPVHHPATS
jgi:predicted NUDIX family phosphoesterase